MRAKVYKQRRIYGSVLYKTRFDVQILKTYESLQGRRLFRYARFIAISSLQEMQEGGNYRGTKELFDKS